jgi:NAD(P)-dependent dehydrogenase (short-subunit alcohol dehydrogenase family)
MMRLKDSNIFLTGGSSGIGLAIMKGFLREGANVAFTYRHESSLMRPDVQEILTAFPQAHPISADFSKPTNGQTLLDCAADHLNNPINVLVNNAAAFSREKLIDTTQESLREILDVNIVTPFMLISAFSKILIACDKPGSIINISSLSAVMARSQMSAYQCSKAGLEMLSNSAAYELAGHRIRSNVIAPGLTETGANQQQRLNQPDIWAKRSSSIPLGRTGQPDDYVGAAIYLASTESQWVTGAKIIIDGGMSTF